MQTYSISKWLLFFGIYCIMGWIFESTYVSLKSRKFVNRGFMYGPYLPIYGFGAITVLFTTLGVRTNIFLVYVVGAFSATLLEYVTGVLMEAIFKVRYWDYSNQKLNFQGHICLSSTVVWGGFSVAMVFGLHRLVEKVVSYLPVGLTEFIPLAILAVMVADFAINCKTAIEFRDILEKIEKVKEELKLLQKRMEVIEAIIVEEKDQKKELLLSELHEIKIKQIIYTDKIKERFGKDMLNLLKRNPRAFSKRYKAVFEEIKERILDRS